MIYYNLQSEYLPKKKQITILWFENKFSNELFWKIIVKITMMNPDRITDTNYFMYITELSQDSTAWEKLGRCIERI